MKIQIRAALIIFFANFLILLLSFTGGAGYVRANIEKYLEAEMTTVADIADRFISAELDLLRDEAGNAADILAAANPADWGGILSERLGQSSRFKGMLILRADGEAEALAGDVPPSADLWQTDGVQRAFSGETAFTSSVPAGDDVVFCLATPITRQHVLALILGSTYFSDLTSEYTIWETGHIFIDDGEGTIIANIRPDWVEDRQNFIRMAQDDPQYGEVAALLERGIRGERGIGYYTMGDISRVCAYRPISSSGEGWFLGVVAPLSESPMRNTDTGLLILAVISVLLNIAAAAIASNFIKKPFEEVAALKMAAEAGLREQEKMMEEIKQRDYLLETVNDGIDRLLRSDLGSFSGILRDCMGMMTQAIGADRMYLHKNHMEGGQRYNTRLFEWAEPGCPPRRRTPDSRFLCDGEALLFREKLRQGESVHALARELPEQCLDCLDARGALSVMEIPIFLRDEFWGFVGFDNCHSERLFTDTEESVMRSGSLLLASALLRNEYMLELRDTSSRLEVALSDAEEANSAKSNFLAHMSHEIRTPLNAVVGLSELALDDEKLGGEMADKLEKIHASGMTILSIVNDILDISKIESGKFELFPGRYDTPSFINDVAALNVVRIGEKPITFRLFVDEELPGALLGDDLRVKQVFNNLLSNAFKYTNAGTVEWRVGFEREGSDIWLVSSVRDTGIGMKPEDVQKLFMDYYQVDGNMSRRVEGTGLGLAITRQLLSMMDGDIAVESEFGEGSCFSVRLRQGDLSEPPIGREVAENLMGLRYTLSKRVGNKKLARVDLSYAQVLVVDDIETNLDVVRGMMKPYGAKVDCVMSGAQAVDLIRAGNPRYSAIFMDHMMPEMDGIEATRIIREEIGTEYARRIPIIALTANAIMGNEEMFLNNGFQAFLSKPIDMAKLDAVLRYWVRDKSREASVAEGASEAEVHYGYGPELLRGAAIEGIDMERALERFGGSEAVLLDVLRSYATNTRPLLARLSEYLSAGDLESYAITVHGVKGSSYGISASETGRQAEQLEWSARAGDVRAVKAGHAGFETSLSFLLDAVDTLLRRVDMAAEKPVAATPDPEQLTRLRDACAAFDMDGVDAALEALEAFRYEQGERLVLWLRQQVDRMDFEAVFNGEWPEI